MKRSRARLEKSDVACVNLSGSAKFKSQSYKLIWCKIKWHLHRNLTGGNKMPIFPTCSVMTAESTAYTSLSHPMFALLYK